MTRSDPTTAAADAFTTGERDYIRQELDRFFSTLPSVADGFQLRTWRGGPQAGQPKVPIKAKGLLERGLMRLEPTPWPPRLFFTEAGLPDLIRPNPVLTPGAVVTTDAAAFCHTGYSRSVRHTSGRLKRDVYRAYGIDRRGGHYELDHLVPLALGGADTLENLWPQPRDTVPWNTRPQRTAWNGG